MKEAFQKLSLIFGMLLIGQILICLVVLIINPGYEPQQTSKSSLLYDSILPIFILSMTFATYLIDNQRRNKGAVLKSLDQKVQYYRQSVLIRLALMESTNIFTIIIILMDGRIYYMIYFVIGLVAFIYFRPSILDFIDGYRLDNKEKETFEAAFEE